ncbi:hypothetical protein JOC86_000849 [Bacillus pakistanensis]|uniref:YpoC-like domain-containing protein n=1 Tax=Rossellomorea pakistanensis TaxID=992288 RepID=A0ABS2N8X1_9BACI|nr:hypothetical protein [Bacillus pakistanensis]MBM7584312.1 hypothetical protein [Bacillus pakistanensis]
MNPIQIPSQLRSELFYFLNEPRVAFDESTNRLHPFFYYEILFYTGKNGERPWENPETFIMKLIEEWNLIKPTLTELFTNRSKEVELHMKKGIAIFFMLLFWSNNKPVRLKDWEEEIKEMHVKAVNLNERLTFVLSNPKMYHSFIQLSELIGEQHKQYAKALAITKKKA